MSSLGYDVNVISHTDYRKMVESKFKFIFLKDYIKKNIISKYENLCWKI